MWEMVQTHLLSQRDLKVFPYWRGDNGFRTESKIFLLLFHFSQRVYQKTTSMSFSTENV